MLLSLCSNQSLSLSPKTLDHNYSSPFLFFSFPQTRPKTLLFQNPKPSKSLIRSSTANSQTLHESPYRRIAEKLRRLGYGEEDPKPKSEPDAPLVSHGSPGEIFVPLPRELPKYRVGHTIDSSWSSPENPVPAPGSGSLIARYSELSREVREQKKQLAKQKKDEEKRPTLAEVTLSKEELRRLQGIGIGIKKKLKIGKPGITEGIVNSIHERWRNTELAKIVCDDLCKLNMKRTHDLLEKKTGGLVIWRSGSNIILYRGPHYVYPYFDGCNSGDGNSSSNSPVLAVEGDVHNRAVSCLDETDGNISPGPIPSSNHAQQSLIPGVGSPNRVRIQTPGEKQLAEEADRLLDGLGPRFADWWGCNPHPVDADLLPGVVSGYRRPFRLLPYGVKTVLTDDEMTTLRRLGRPLPCHFALGRNRKHQGLAASIVKLWEKCELAKIAVKRGVQNTNSELMAEELKRLTGGTLLSRDKDFIVLYRGKDFLPLAVSSAIEARRKFGMGEGNQWEDLSDISMADNMKHLSEDEREEINEQKRIRMLKQKKIRSTGAAINRTKNMLSRALEKRAEAEKLLSELDERQILQQPDVDKEGITEEERYMLRRVGLKMKPFLLLGRRGVFDGTVENMHLHWKYRELVKILCNEKNNEEAYAIAKTLEAESGGILVAVERVGKGSLIIVYRGKNYIRPASLRPQTLLNKRQAMKRSIEAQRRESLKLQVLKLNRNIDDMQHQLDKDEELKMKLLADASELQIEEEDTHIKQPPEHGKLYSEPEPGSSSSPKFYQHDETNMQDGDGYWGMERRDREYAIEDRLNTPQEDTNSLANEVPFEEANGFVPRPTSFSVRAVLNKNNSDACKKKLEAGDISYTSRPENFQSQGWTKRPASGNAEHHVLMGVANHGLGPSDLGAESETTIKAAKPLSNKDRLLLRKQALRMKKRPVLAVGRSNVITGVAKTIMTHFKKHPLAIVNVKARSEGTPIQELVFKLEQETGAVLVSQETNKIILYRGWGAGIESRCADKEITGDQNRQSVRKEVENPPTVSPALMAAIRSECGL